MNRIPIFLLFSLLLLAPAGGRAEPPNIVFILADDLGYGDPGCYGQKLMETPNLDRLADEGIRFTQAYAGGPVCASSRSVFLTGRHAGRTAARDNVPHYPTYLEEEDVTVAEVLRDAGYRTGGVGKWSLGDAGTVGRATNQGFDEWFGYLNQDHAHYYWTEYLDDGEGRRELPGNPVEREHYSHDLLAERGLEFIRKSANRKEPFFFYGAWTLPHFSSRSEDKDGLAVPSTDPYGDRDWPVKAKKYAAMIARIDRDVGRILDLLDELGVAEETLVVFTSDNGGHSTTWEEFDTNGPLRGHKRDLTEGGIRVPFLARWTGTIPAGAVSDEVIAFEDLMPTFAELAGAEPPKDIDGLSVTEALRGGSLGEERDFLYWDYGHCRRYYDQAVRIGDWKGIRLGKEGGRVRLYDLSRDPGEENDVSASHPEVVARAEGILDEVVEPNPRYPIGEIYRGGAIWRAENHHPSIAASPPLAEVGEGAVVGSEFLFDPGAAPTPSCHSSTIVETPSGLVAAWFGGTSEPDIDNEIWVSRQVEGEWSKPVSVADGTEEEARDHRVGNPVLFRSREGLLLLFYKVVDPEVGRASSWWGRLMSSDDDGATWSESRRLGTSDALGVGNPNLLGPVKNKPIQLDDGAILCPSSTEHDGWRVHFEVTRDLGKTWEVIGPIHDGSNFSFIQPSLLLHGGDRMQVVGRTREGVVAQAWSEDGGKSWGAVTATHLPNPNSGTDAVTLADGRHLLVYNHTIKRGPYPRNRNRLDVAISDDGKQWNPVLVLEREEASEFSYPAVIQAADGKVHITYTWKRKSIRHVVLDPAKLAAPGERGSSGQSPAKAATRETPKPVPVFEAGEDGYEVYRIPAIVRARNGHLLAFCEARQGGDASEIDLVLKRSRDGGKTWGPLRVVQESDDFRSLFEGEIPPITVGNPAPVVDLLDPEEQGRIWLPFTLENDRVFVVFSDDHGVTWSERREITAEVKNPGWGWYATGPVHSIQVRNGEHRGRLVVPGDHRLGVQGADDGPLGAQAILSDDHGRTWRLGFIDETYEDGLNANETTVVELGDGTLYFNTRNQKGAAPGTRGEGWSADGGATIDSRDPEWKNFRPAPEVLDPPVVQGALLRAESGLVIFSGPDENGPSGPGRSDLRLRISRDEAKSWKDGPLLHVGPAAYSDLVELEGGIGVLFENGDAGQKSAYERISFLRVPEGNL